MMQWFYEDDGSTCKKEERRYFGVCHKIHQDYWRVFEEIEAKKDVYAISNTEMEFKTMQLNY